MTKATKQQDQKLVWAFQELRELQNRVGFVSCDEDLAQKLLKEEKVQDAALGAMALNPIGINVKKVTKAKPKATRTKVIKDTEV